MPFHRFKLVIPTLLFLLVSISAHSQQVKDSTYTFIFKNKAYHIEEVVGGVS